MPKPTKISAASLWDVLKSYENLPNASKFIEEMGRGFQPEPVQKTSSEVSLDKPSLVPIKELTRLYGLKLSAVYGLIHTDSTFPAVNVGLKKKYMIDLNEFNKWLDARNEKEKKARSKEPTSQDLLKIFRERKK